MPTSDNPRSVTFNVKIDECRERGCLSVSDWRYRHAFMVGCAAAKSLHLCCALCVAKVLENHTSADCMGAVVTHPSMNFRWDS